MLQIKDTKLEDLVARASQELLEEMRIEGVTQIKKIYQKQYVLTKEIKNDEQNLNKKKESLKRAEDTIVKLQAGDWTALKDDNKQE